MVDPTDLTLGVVAGVAAGLSLSYFAFYSRGRRPKVKVFQRDSDGQMRMKTVRMDDLERAKRETKTMTLERDLLSAALTKVYEAETQGRITRDERETIAKKYSDQLKEMDMRLQDRELVVEVGELENLRDELVTLFTTKVENIEARLEQAKERLTPLREELGLESPPQSAPAPRPVPAAATVAEGSGRMQVQSRVDDLERAVERRAPQRREESEGERRARELRDEVMDALTKLEQIDTRRENEEP